jgi:hypothetical protein
VAVAGVVTVGSAVVFGGPSAATASHPAGGTQVVAAAPVSTHALTPSRADASAIAEAVRTSELTSQVPAGSYQVSGTRLAASDPAWAWTELRPTVDNLDRAQGVLHRTPQGWQLVQLGSYEVGCSITPAPVRADLGLECPSLDAPVYTT